MRSLLSFCLVLSAAGIAHGDPQKGPRVVIVPIAAVNVDTQRVDALAADLADGLTAELIVDAIGGLDVRRVLKPDMPADCATQPACAADIAKITGAQQILFVAMVDAGGTGSLQVDSVLVEPSTGKTDQRPGVSLSSTIDADARQAFRDAATKLLPNATPRPKAKLGSAVSVDGQLVDGKPRHITTPAIITAGVAVVGLGAGIGFGLSARSAYKTCEGDPDHCSDDAKDSIRHKDLYADLSFGVAIAAAVATGVLFMTSAEAPHVIAAPAESGAGGSVFYVGRF
ncbi:MAG: hypothetical protein QM831_22905 [Kofleriaceae bacterium]